MTSVFLENLILNYFSEDWNNIIKKYANVNLSFENFLNKINIIPNKNAPLKKVSKQNTKLESMPFDSTWHSKILMKNKLICKT